MTEKSTEHISDSMRCHIMLMNYAIQHIDNRTDLIYVKKSKKEDGACGIASKLIDDFGLNFKHLNLDRRHHEFIILDEQEPEVLTMFMKQLKLLTS